MDVRQVLRSRPRPNHTLVKAIALGKHGDEFFGLEFSVLQADQETACEFFEEFNVNFKNESHFDEQLKIKEYNDAKSPFLYFVINSSSERFISKLFLVFTRNKLIPQTIVDDLMKHSPVSKLFKDFDADVNAFVVSLNEKLKEKAAKTINFDYKNFIVKEAQSIENYDMRDKLTGGLIEFLKEQAFEMAYSGDLTLLELRLSLCNHTFNSESSYLMWICIEEAKILLRLNRGKPKEQRYLPALVALNFSPYRNDHIRDLYVQIFSGYNGTDFLTSEWENLSFSQESLEKLMKLLGSSTKRTTVLLLILQINKTIQRS